MSELEIYFCPTCGGKLQKIDDTHWKCSFCCSGLTSITIPDSVASIGNYVFYECSGLTSVNYTGTKKQWHNIIKGYDWKGSTGDFTIHCTDGDIAKFAS